MVNTQNQPHPMTLISVKSVCHILFGVVVLSLNSSAALMTIWTGLVMRSWDFSS